jgi:hypothetical protein
MLCKVFARIVETGQETFLNMQTLEEFNTNVRRYVEVEGPQCMLVILEIYQRVLQKC